MGPAVATDPTPDSTVAEQLDALWLDLVWRDPEQVTDLGLARLFPGRPKVDDRLTDLSEAYVTETERRTRVALAAVQDLDTAALSEAERQSADVLAWYLDDLVRGQRFRRHDYPVSQLFTPQNAVPDLLINLHPLTSLADARHYVARLQAFGPKLDALTAQLDAREQAGLLPPRFVLADTAEQMRSFRAAAPHENPLVVALAARLDALPALTPEDQARLLTDAEAAVRDLVLPAYGRLLERVEALEGATDDRAGAWKLPAGEAYYAWALRHHTTIDLSPEEVRQIGLAAVADRQAALHAALARLGHDDADLGLAMVRAARALGGYEPLDSDADRTRVLAEYQRLTDTALARLGPLFGRQPATGVRVERVPAYREGAAGAWYLAPPLDGSRPGIVFVGLGGDVAVRTTRATTAYHEGVPGHHFQLALQRELTDGPLFRRALVFNAFAEGWALYAEQLAAESGLYADDPLGELGYLQMQLFRAARLVTDTGLHHQRWTRDEATDYLATATGLPDGFAQAEVDRYAALPGQAASYWLGYRAIQALREALHAALGPRFDLARFHDAVLRQGSLPLPLLEQVVRAELLAPSE